MIVAERENARAVRHAGADSAGGHVRMPRADPDGHRPREVLLGIDRLGICRDRHVPERQEGSGDFRYDFHSDHVLGEAGHRSDRGHINLEHGVSSPVHTDGGSDHALPRKPVIRNLFLQRERCLERGSAELEGILGTGKNQQVRPEGEQEHRP